MSMMVKLLRSKAIPSILTIKDDTLPDRMLKEPMPDGFAEGEVVDLEPMIDEYYRFRGWDKSSGFPTKKRLSELGLDDLAAELGSIGKLTT